MRALIFDLDGTLIDTVYAHVFAWQRALAEAGLAIDDWKIHIGMSGGLFTRAVAREIGRPLSDDDAGRIQTRHGVLFRELLPERRPCPARSICCAGCASKRSRTGSRRPAGTRRSTARLRPSVFRPIWS